MANANAFATATAAILLLVTHGHAQDVTRPGNTITGSSANFPAGEPPAAAIDNTGRTKYLNFDELNTGFTVSPTGTGVVRGLVIMTANDAPERDPTSFVLEGSNDGSTFTPIAQGALNPPTARRGLTGARFANTATFAQYRVRFPTVRNAAAANSMQVAEVQLTTALDILTPGDPFVVTYTPGASSPPNEGPANLWDDLCGAKMGVFGGNLGPTVIDVTPGVGASTVTGMSIFSANDDQGFPGRTPASVTLYGSNDGANFSLIFSTALAAATDNFQDQEFGFANATSYLHYRLEFGPSSASFTQLGEVQLLGNAANTPPANDACASAQVVGPGTVSASNFNATGTDITACGTSDTADVWFSYVSGVTGTVEVNTFGATALDTTLAIYPSCGAAAIGCDDNSRRSKSRVRFSATAGTTYLIRVAGVGETTGNFFLTIDEAPVVHNDTPVALNYNFNGMVHPGEDDDPDSPTGFRSISDRGLRIVGLVGSVEVGLEGGTGIPYTVNPNAGQLDIVHLGNRNTTDGGRWRFDDLPGQVDPPNPENDIGIQPHWLSCTDQSSPQVTDVCRLGMVLGASTQVGVLYNISNGGGFFDIILGFADGTTVSATLQGPDWFGDQQPQDPLFGVAYQEQLGVFFGSQMTDIGTPGTDLNVVEAIVTRDSLFNDFGIDIAGRQLTSISFANPTNVVGYAIFAVTVRNPGSANPSPSCAPIAAGAATPPTVGNGGSGSTHLSVVLTPGSGPAGTGAGVTINIAGIGGAVDAMMFDDGMHNDGAAGDNVFGLDVTVPSGTPTGVVPNTFFFTDAQGRSGMGTICVTVTPPPPVPPANDTCANATPITGPGTYAFDTTSATPDGPAYCTGNGSGSVWFAYTGTPGTTATVSTCGQASFDTVLAATDACGNAAVACNDDDCALQSTITLPPATGTPVLIRISGFGAAFGAGNIVITETGCPVDFNGDGELNADDLSDYITCFFTEAAFPGSCPEADFNGVDGINADDLSDYITAYFLGCP